MNFKFSLLLFLFVFLFSSFAFSQGKITGYVIDSKDNNPIKDASVKITLQTDSTVTTGANTDVSGLFIIDKLKAGTYKLSVSFIGYATFLKANIKIDEANNIIFLDTIKLKPDSYKTDEIKVESEAPLMELKDDKKIFNVEKMLSIKGGTALDVLKKVPMIDVDASDNVSLRGSRNAIILIDNKPMKFSSLRQLPADAIKNVEIITNPSAKYEAEGVTGIINIVLKEKNPDMTGYNGWVYGAFDNKARFYASLGVNIKINKWSFFVNLGGGAYKYSSSNNSKSSYSNPISFFESSGYGEGNSKYTFPSLGVEYEFSKNHSIGFDSYVSISKNENNNSSKSYNYNSIHNLSSYYTNDNIGNGDWKNYNGSLYYSGKLDNKGKDLNAELSYNVNKYKNTSNQNILNYDSLFIPLTLNGKSNQINTTDGNSSNARFQIDYTHPINDNYKFETGYKGILKMDDNDFHSDTVNFNNNTTVENLNATNHFKLTESVNALYTTLSRKIKDFRVKLGLRIEHTHTKGELITNNTIFTKDYFDLFPTVSISQKFGLKYEIQASYSRRITRPMIYRLNPFRNRYNYKFVYMGNPDLSPEFTDSFELTNSFYSGIGTITPMIFYRKSYNVISSFSYVEDTTTTINTYRNSAGAKAYGLDLILNSNVLKWWSLNSSFSFYKSQFEGSITNDYTSEEGFSWQGRVRSTFTLSDLFNIEIYYNYSGKKFTATGFNEPSSSLAVAISKDFFKKKMNINFRVDDLLKTTKWGSETNGLGVKYSYSGQWDSRAFNLTLSYNFGNTDQYYSKTKKTKKNENENQDQQNENGK